MDIVVDFKHYKVKNVSKNFRANDIQLYVHIP